MLLAYPVNDPLVGEQAILNTALDSAKSFTVSAIFNLATPPNNTSYGIGLTDNLPGQLGTDTVLFGLYTSNGTTIINLVQDDDQIDGSQDLGSIPLSDLNSASANEIEFTLTYTPRSGASNLDDLVATVQLLDKNGNPVGSPQSVGSATIFSSTDDFIIPTFGVHAPAPDSVLQGTYGTLGVLQNGQWAYILNPYTSQYQALDLGQMATDNFTIQLASFPGGSGTSTGPVTIDVVGVSPGVLNPIAQNTPQNATSPPGEFDRGDLHR